MADYFSPTVIQPDIPVADISPLELYLMKQMFQFEPYDGVLYFFAETSIVHHPTLDVDELRDALGASKGFQSRVADEIERLLSEAATTEADIGGEQLDVFEDDIYLIILQDIIRRSAEIGYFTISTAFTCSKMRVDGFLADDVLIGAYTIHAEVCDGAVADWEGDDL